MKSYELLGRKVCVHLGQYSGLIGIVTKTCSIRSCVAEDCKIQFVTTEGQNILVPRNFLYLYEDVSKIESKFLDAFSIASLIERFKK